MTNYFVELNLSPDGIVYSTSETQGAALQENSHLGKLHSLSPSLHFWRSFSRKLITQMCKLNHSQEFPKINPPGITELQEIIQRAPFMRGAEYLSSEVLLSIWQRIEGALREELKSSSGSVYQYLQQFDPRWNLVGRVCFHLAENKNDETRPFAFLATYTTHISQKKRRDA